MSSQVKDWCESYPQCKQIEDWQLELHINNEYRYHDATELYQFMFGKKLMWMSCNCFQTSGWIAAFKNKRESW